MFTFSTHLHCIVYDMQVVTVITGNYHSISFNYLTMLHSYRYLYAGQTQSITGGFNAPGAFRPPAFGAPGASGAPGQAAPFTPPFVPGQFPGREMERRANVLCISKGVVFTWFFHELIPLMSIRYALEPSVVALLNVLEAVIDCQASYIHSFRFLVSWDPQVLPTPGATAQPAAVPKDRVPTFRSEEVKTVGNRRLD